MTTSTSPATIPQEVGIAHPKSREDIPVSFAVAVGFFLIGVLSLLVKSRSDYDEKYKDVPQMSPSLVALVQGERFLVEEDHWTISRLKQYAGSAPIEMQNVHLTVTEEQALRQRTKDRLDR